MSDRTRLDRTWAADSRAEEEKKYRGKFHFALLDFTDFLDVPESLCPFAPIFLVCERLKATELGEL